MAFSARARTASGLLGVQATPVSAKATTADRKAVDRIPSTLARILEKMGRSI
jgi:hypothetical protein